MVRENRFRLLADGTDALWDSPYFRHIPALLQKMVAMLIFDMVLVMARKFMYSWRWGENYISVSRK
jgi:hypothetical protein